MTPQDHIQALYQHYTSIMRTLETQGAVYVVGRIVTGRDEDTRAYRRAERALEWVERLSEEESNG